MESSFFTGCIFRIWNRNYKLIKHQHKSSNNVSYYWSDCRSLGTNMVLWRLSAREWKLSGERNWQVWHLTWDERDRNISHLTGSRSDLHHYSPRDQPQTNTGQQIVFINQELEMGRSWKQNFITVHHRGWVVMVGGGLVMGHPCKNFHSTTKQLSQHLNCKNRCSL